VRFQVLTAVKMTMLFWFIPGSALKMETLYFFETLVSSYESTRRHNDKYNIASLSKCFHKSSVASKQQTTNKTNKPTITISLKILVLENRFAL
jgi:hypothetical protein